MIPIIEANPARFKVKVRAASDNGLRLGIVYLVEATRVEETKTRGLLEWYYLKGHHIPWLATEFVRIAA